MSLSDGGMHHTAACAFLAWRSNACLVRCKSHYVQLDVFPGKCALHISCLPTSMSPLTNEEFINLFMNEFI